MIQDELQQRVHAGERDAFREVYGRYSREVYALAHTALGNADSARAVVRQVFLQLYRELMRADSDLDLPARLSALTNEEIRITRIAAGDLSPDALQVQCTVSAESGPDTSDTMVRIRARMAGQPAAEPPREPAAPLPAEETAAVPAWEEGSAPAAALPAEDLDPLWHAGEPAPAAEEPVQTQQTFSDPLPPREEDAAHLGDLAPVKKRRGAGGTIALILLILFLAVFLWLLAGILMDLGILPFYDLGYRFFNENVFEFFRLP